MRIKRVEIIGFKSFCDRAVVQIGESITGVVGPNGCGKSNIVDAIRWCMGEQSAKHLRGKAMEDVIFAGSETRGPAPMAEVSLTFDDVGFSHETLEQARHSDEAETERALAQLAPEEGAEGAESADGTESADGAEGVELPGDSVLARAVGVSGSAVAETVVVSASDGAIADAVIAEPAVVIESVVITEHAVVTETVVVTEEAIVAETEVIGEVIAEAVPAGAPGDEAGIDISVLGGDLGDGEAAEPMPAATGTWVDAEGNPIASPLEEAAQVLADRPPAINFGHYTEVTITRRLYRDGTSQYFINKTPCRLRDITDFFLGTGVGTKAYAIIEQGRIGQIVSSRPQDRRAIIEEAAGITKFKAKKKAAERKLDQTRQNLMRVSDIVAELDKRMGTLRRQAQKAERYRKYKAEMRDIELWKAAHRWLELGAEDKLVNGRLGDARTELDDARAAWGTKDAHVVAERAELAVEERRLVGLQEQLYELDNRIRLGESKIGFERREADELDGRIAAARGEIDGITVQRVRGAEELAARQGELAELEDEVTREAAEVEAREAAAGEARQMLVNAQRLLDQARAELGAQRTEIATANTQLDALGRRQSEASRRLERVVSELDQQTERVRELEREGKRVDSALAQLRQTRLDLGSQSEGFTARKELLTDEVTRGESEVETLRTELHRRNSRLTSLREIQERYEGFQRGTRAVMQRADDIVDPRSDTAAIHGVVADVVRAPELLEVAVEAALGDRLGGVLVSEPEVGLAAVGFLKQGGGGRSAFVPLMPASRNGMAMAGANSGVVSAPVTDSATVPATFEGEGGAASWISPAWEPAGGSTDGAKIEVEDRTQLVAAHAAIGGEGVLGRMVDLVAFSDGYEAVGKRLLGATVVVDHLDRALALHKEGVTDRLVTLDGDIVDDDGVVAGGSREAQGAGVLAQKREIRDLEDIVGTLEHDLSEATARLVTAKTELKQVTKALEGLRTQFHEGEVAIMGHEKDETRIRHDLERYRDRLGQLSGEQRELEDRLRAIGVDETATKDRRTAAEARIAELERAQLDHLSDVTAHRDRLDDLARVLTEVKIRAAQLGEKRAAAEASALRLAAMDADLVKRAGKLNAEIDEAVRRAGTLREGCDQLATELAQLREQRAAHGASLDEGRQTYDARLTALTEVEIASRELRGKADQLSKEVGQLELRAGQIRMTRQVVEEQIDERYQLAVPAILHDYHLRPQITQIEDDRLGELRELIDRMGTDINLTAIDEYAEVGQRFEFLSAQKTDLERAVDQLQRAIDKINKTSRKLFKDTFASVNATFKEVFPRLFRGGQAALSLSGGEDVDLLEAGVEIMAQPPGKKNSTVEQLSGGEKALTAVALVFSIFLIKPSPFCILDEVDAPLDEANVDRYNELVREMTDRSQFIVITHNKRTMEAADNLYGVTMQEPGVSKLVSVNLSKLGSRSGGASSEVAA